MLDRQSRGGLRLRFSIPFAHTTPQVFLATILPGDVWSQIPLNVRRGGPSASAIRLLMASKSTISAKSARRTTRSQSNGPAPSVEPACSIREFFAARGWTPFTFQEEAWRAYLAGKSGLIHAPTGVGKTFAAWGGVIDDYLRDHPDAGTGEPFSAETDTGEPCMALWITPLRALANDTLESLIAPVRALNLPWTIELRHGDTPSSVRQRQKKRFPTALVTTPESLTLLLSYPDARTKFRNLRAIVVDEWHELLGSKRGTQTELALARLRTWLPDIRMWGLSASLGNLDEAMDVLLGNRIGGTLVQGDIPKEIEVDTLIPDDIESFPWSGHLGVKLLDAVIERIEAARSTLFFTNTRSQTEIWFRAIREKRPDWEDRLFIHHGSLERELRKEVEAALDDGRAKAVVCTSSLDLGVDFSPVDQVMQVGSPKGVARLLQRAGRSGHQPGKVSRVVGVPTNAFELIEFAAARDALAARAIESRHALEKPLDVLTQHIVTTALAGPFDPAELFREVTSTRAYRDLTKAEWRWAVDFVASGGEALSAYPDYRKLELVDGRYQISSPRIARFHRMSVGTITSDSEVIVKFQTGRVLGSVEEGFVSRMKPGDTFNFAGRRLQLVRFHGFNATVKAAGRRKGSIPSWQGGRMPLSSELARAVGQKMRDANAGTYSGREMEAARNLLEIQKALSVLPIDGVFLAEHCRNRYGFFCFLYPFAGRLVHEGLAALVAWRLAQSQPITIRTTASDYGFSLQTQTPFVVDAEALAHWFSKDNLLDDLLACMNSAELAKRKFREISRIAGLVIQGYPGQRKNARQVQASSGLLYDVFTRYDPDNLLLDQARREILEQQLELTRLSRTLDTIAGAEQVIRETKQFTPMAFPLWADQQKTEMASTEDWESRILRMVSELEETVAAG